MPTATAASRWWARWRSRGCAARHRWSRRWLRVAETAGNEEPGAGRDLVRMARLDRRAGLGRRVTPEDQFRSARLRAAGAHRRSEAAARRDWQGAGIAPPAAGDFRRAAGATCGAFART